MDKITRVIIQPMIIARDIHILLKGLRITGNTRDDNMNNKPIIPQTGYDDFPSQNNNAAISKITTPIVNPNFFRSAGDSLMLFISAKISFITNLVQIPFSSQYLPPIPSARLYRAGNSPLQDNPYRYA